MCLTKVTRAKIPVGEVKAWKVFSTDSMNPTLHIKLSFPYRGGNVQEDKWLVAKGKPIHYWIATSAKYEAGFHAFATKKAANMWLTYEIGEKNGVVRSVILRDITTVGVQTIIGLAREDYDLTRTKLKMYVAKQMFVPKEGKLK